jgi:hypothetical protein
MEKYLKWRFMNDSYIRGKYGKYCDDWINNLTEEQLTYFKIEKERLTQRGIYHD